MTRSETTLAWHFTAPGGALRYDHAGYVPEIGETLRHDGPLELCKSGLHASVRALDALRYAPSFWVSRVLLSGEIIHDSCKVVASERTVLWRADATSAVVEFARWCARRAAQHANYIEALPARSCTSALVRVIELEVAVSAEEVELCAPAAPLLCMRVAVHRTIELATLLAECSGESRQIAIDTEERSQDAKLTELLHALKEPV